MFWTSKCRRINESPPVKDDNNSINNQWLSQNPRPSCCRLFQKYLLLSTEVWIPLLRHSILYIHCFCFLSLDVPLVSHISVIMTLHSSFLLLFASKQEVTFYYWMFKYPEITFCKKSHHISWLNWYWRTLSVESEMLNSYFLAQWYSL